MSLSSFLATPQQFCTAYAAMPTRVFRPFDATTTGALNDGIPVPVGSALGFSQALSGLRRPVASRPYLVPLTPMGLISTRLDELDWLSS
jgi:hypothetical protein